MPNYAPKQLNIDENTLILPNFTYFSLKSSQFVMICSEIKKIEEDATRIEEDAAPFGKEITGIVRCGPPILRPAKVPLKPLQRFIISTILSYVFSNIY